MKLNVELHWPFRMHFMRDLGLNNSSCFGVKGVLPDLWLQYSIQQLTFKYDNPCPRPLFCGVFFEKVRWKRLLSKVWDLLVKFDIFRYGFPYQKIGKHAGWYVHLPTTLSLGSLRRLRRRLRSICRCRRRIHDISSNISRFLSIKRCQSYVREFLYSTQTDGS